MGWARIAGQQFFPSQERRYPTSRFLQTLLNLVRVHKLAGTKASSVDLLHEFHRLTRDRAQVIRMWLPALGLAVLFTRDGVKPLSRPATSRSYYRELKCFPLQVLWQALGIDQGFLPERRRTMSAAHPPRAAAHPEQQDPPRYAGFGPATIREPAEMAGEE